MSKRCYFSITNLFIENQLKGANSNPFTSRRKGHNSYMTFSRNKQINSHLNNNKFMAHN